MSDVPEHDHLIDTGKGKLTLDQLGSVQPGMARVMPEIGARILDGMLGNVVARVKDEHKLDLAIAPEVKDALRELCIADLGNGGRGIGNRLESLFVNPLSRALFRFPLEGRTAVTVTALTADDDRVMTVTLA